ncbi:hypothetical protein [uncultured Serinicoccus sp.]|uniref:hypothetical protein n=1 Tax=uncultured Serinicoccus sp. TaxID=735514 RepID=UPI00260A3682|nr:hypothetical protein [uncultured Serinicoccus sp.]
MGDGSAPALVAGSLWSVPADKQVPAVLARRPAGLRRLHWDTTDGRFAAPGGFGPAEAARISEATGTEAEAHVMAHHPSAVVDAWADVCGTVFLHAESQDWQGATRRLERRGTRPGLAISPGTSVDVVPDGMAVLVMSVVPGRAGTAFDLGALVKVARLRDRDPHRPIGLDGGVRREHADRALAAGVTWMVVGTDLFSDDGAARWGDLLTRVSPPGAPAPRRSAAGRRPRPSP